MKNHGPVVSGVAGGAAGNITRQTLKVLTGKQCSGSLESLLIEIGAGGAAGAFFGSSAKAGITIGRNSYNAIYKHIMTKCGKGLIQRVSPRTAAKMFIGRGTDTGAFTGTIGGPALSSAATDIAGKPDCSCP